MSDYIVLENIPNTPEGRAFLKQLRKYLRPQYTMRSRGRHSDRKGLAQELAKKGVYLDVAEKLVNPEGYVHAKLRNGMSCKHAERITTVIECKNDRNIKYVHKGTKKIKRGFYFYRSTYDEQTRFGPFKTWDAAVAAQRVSEGI